MNTSTNGEFPTGNYALATTLATVGFPPAFERLCFNAYYGGARPDRGSDGRLNKLGVVKFKFDRKLKGYPDTIFQDVLDAYDGKTTPGDELDKIVDDIGDRGTRDSIRELLPQAYAECARNALANLRDIREMPHKTKALIVIVRDAGMPMVIQEDVTEEIMERWGVTK